ncbi:hypothetical protein Enr13x_71740 [Stieleria neptunia]|uniref:Uncharacterized protein n=1 Tax=Stieleria neptunia TaxID=2527979 RepID=A0A518I2C5_9BACT|nr:hypothetical protein [Stieleria neptunia]QDV47265.1 hypothetical protein Enr13x_71740 [Stieleria neptunia]
MTVKTDATITTKFNALLVLYSAVVGVFTFAMSDSAKGVPLEGIILTSLIDLVRFLIMVFVTAWFAKEVWNRLVTDMFDVRCVVHRETIAIVLLLGILLD